MCVSFFIVERCTLPMRYRCNNLKYYDFKEENTMKKIINGKLYNTETAKEVGQYWNGYGGGDFYHICETLYLKKTGEYFLHGEGGAMTHYREACAGGWTGSSVITPYTEEEAKEWAVEHMDADDYMELFGEVEE